MNVAQIIEKKRDGKHLDDTEIAFLVEGYARDRIPPYQMSAFAMAVFFTGMTLEETTTLTRCMIDSGIRMDWPNGRPKVDKHSTGGIGDKVSIPLAPMLACCGADVPMISGRGLGTTGGTLDKLESIPGYRCELSVDEFRSIVNWNGCSIAGASEEIAPADKKLYALRDVTATVPSVPLITASILSKKVAEGIDSLVLDVKFGSGAFMPDIDSARELAESLVDVGNKLGVKTTALLTDMNQPLGNMIGNALEIVESIEILKGQGPPDVTELTYRLGSELLVTSGLSASLEKARVQLENSVSNGEALKKFQEMASSHGGQLNELPQPANEFVVISNDSGFVSMVNANRLGLAIIEMGGGRKKMGDAIDHTVGIEFLVNLGSPVEIGQPLAKLFCHEEEKKLAENLVLTSIGLSPIPPEPCPLVVERIS